MLAADEALLHDLLEGQGPRQRRALARTITLLESRRADHRARADELLNALLPASGKSLRIGRPACRASARAPSSRCWACI